MSQFKIEHQKKRLWCWAAVSATVAKYFYPNEPAWSQCDIAKEVLNSKECCSPDPNACDCLEGLPDVLNELSSKMGRPLHPQRHVGPIDFDEIVSEIKKCNPVCARIQWFGGGGHFVIISGCYVSAAGVDWLRISDPANEQVIIPYNSFATYYRGAGWWTHTYLVSKV